MIVIDQYLLKRSVSKRLNEMKPEDMSDPVLYHRVCNETERIIRESICESLVDVVGVTEITYSEDTDTVTTTESTTESKWIFTCPDTDTMACEKCDYNIPSGEFATPHCPWCGRYMNGWDKICEVEYDEKEEDANEQ